MKFKNNTKRLADKLLLIDRLKDLKKKRFNRKKYELKFL